MLAAAKWDFAPRTAGVIEPGQLRNPPLSLVNRPTLIAEVMAMLPSRLQLAAYPSEIAIIESPNSNEQVALQNLPNAKTQPPTRFIALDEA